jgi:hypothetical protein
MNPEQARALRDGHSRPLPAPFLPQPESLKRRELHFDETYPAQLPRAAELLAGLPGLYVEPGSTATSLAVSYELREYTLEGLEAALVAQGFRFDHSFGKRFARAIIHFKEETQLRNMRVPERLIKKSQQVYSKAWDKHLHGDFDDTPPEMRRDR